jgi:hypothetical protein
MVTVDYDPLEDWLTGLPDLPVFSGPEASRAPPLIAILGDSGSFRGPINRTAGAGV